jgi:hypothetical protein
LVPRKERVVPTLLVEANPFPTAPPFKAATTLRGDEKKGAN